MKDHIASAERRRGMPQDCAPRVREPERSCHTANTAGNVAVRGALASNGAGCIDGSEPGNFQIVVDVNGNSPNAYTAGLARKVYFQRFRASRLRSRQRRTFGSDRAPLPAVRFGGPARRSCRSTGRCPNIHVTLQLVDVDWVEKTPK